MAVPLLRSKSAIFIFWSFLALMGCDEKKPPTNKSATASVQPTLEYSSKLFQRQSGSKAVPLPGTMRWAPDGETHLKYHAAAGVAPTAITLKRPMPNGLIEAVAEYQGVAVVLPLDLDDSVCNDSDTLRDTCLVEIGLHDFDKDGTPEIVIAIGDTVSSLRVNVIKYFPPALESAAGRSENWQLMAKIDGQSNMKITSNTIELPYGSQGLFEEYTWIKDKFVQTN